MYGLLKSKTSEVVIGGGKHRCCFPLRISHNGYECLGGVKASQHAIKNLMGLIHHYFYHLHLLLLLQLAKTSSVETVNGSSCSERLRAKKRCASHFCSDPNVARISWRKSHSSCPQTQKHRKLCSVWRKSCLCSNSNRVVARAALTGARAPEGKMEVRVNHRGAM